MKTKLFMLMLIVCFFMSGCQTENENLSTDNNSFEGQGVEEEPDSFQEIANRIANLAARVPEVNQANALVLGPYAIVGIDVDGELDQSHVGSVKYQVAETLKSDPYGANAAITADPDIINRIQEMRIEIGQGQPLDAIGDELAGIIGRLLPVIPTHEQRNEEPLQSEPSSEAENDSLGKIRNEQSKGRIEEP